MQSINTKVCKFALIFIYLPRFWFAKKKTKILFYWFKSFELHTWDWTHPILYKINSKWLTYLVCESMRARSLAHARDNNNNLFECIIRLIESVNCVEVVVDWTSNQKRMSEWKRACVQSTWISIALTNNNTYTHTHTNTEREVTPDSIYYLWQSREREKKSDCDSSTTSSTSEYWVFIPLTRSQWQLNITFFFLTSSKYLIIMILTSL